MAEAEDSGVMLESSGPGEGAGDEEMTDPVEAESFADISPDNEYEDKRSEDLPPNEEVIEPGVSSSLLELTAGDLDLNDESPVP
jgi:hypothetical protein